MLILDGPTAQALVNLRGSGDFSTVVKWLQENQTKLEKQCVKGEGVALHRTQGAAAAFAELTRAIDEAPEALKSNTRR